jgi:predicted ArsR family transcriptional regulator
MRGPQTLAELGCEAGVCGEAVRQQLNRLAAEGLVVATAQPRGVGRPAQVWSLTPAANAHFPDCHADLSAQLIRLIRSNLGDDVMDKLLDSRAAEAQSAYAAAVAGADDLGERVTRLAAARTREGYMAEARPDGDGYLLVENHCPICVAASACQAFCRTELDTFRAVLGPDVSVERTEHIVSGDRRCAYRITPGPVTNPASEKKMPAAVWARPASPESGKGSVAEGTGNHRASRQASRGPSRDHPGDAFA